MPVPPLLGTSHLVVPPLDPVIQDDPRLGAVLTVGRVAVPGGVRFVVGCIMSSSSSKVTIFIRSG